MPAETHSQIASFIWSICNLLRGPYKRNEYRKVILPLTVLHRFDCILAPTKATLLKEHAAIKAKGDNIIRHRLSQITGVPFFNLSKFTLGKAAQGQGAAHRRPAVLGANGEKPRQQTPPHWRPFRQRGGS